MPSTAAAQSATTPYGASIGPAKASTTTSPHSGASGGPPGRAPIYVILDNLCAHKGSKTRELLNAGLSTQAIRGILPCLESPRDPIVFEGVTPETVAALNTNGTG